MKIDHQENCEYRFSSISIDFYLYYRFFLFRFKFGKNAMDERLALFAIAEKEFIELLIVEAHFPLIKLLSLRCLLTL